MNESKKYDEMVVQFFDLEEELDLFDLNVANIPIWEWIRFDTYREILLKAGVISTPHTNTSSSYRSYLQGFKLFTRNLFVKNPLLSKPASRLYIGTSRRKQLEDGLWWDLICDPIHEQETKNYIQIDPPYKNGHKKPVKTNALRYLDLILYTGKISKKLPRVEFELSQEDCEIIDSIENSFAKAYNINISLIEKIKRVLIQRKYTRPLYRLLLKKVNPEVVIIVCAHSFPTFIETCKNMDVPVVELQHGGFGPDHPGYSFPGHRTKSTFPDYLFTFGDYWKENIEFPIPDNNIYSVGYPYLERQKEKYNHVQNEKRILFLSQGPIGEQLTQFAVDFAQIEEEYEVFVKLHPGEYSRWRRDYPWLKSAPLTVIDGQDPPLYRLLSSSSIQVGVNTTVIYEGLNFDIETYLLDLPGVTRLEHLAQKGHASIISSVNELYDKIHNDEINIKKQGNEFNTDYYFEPNSIENIESALSEIVSRD